VTPEPGRESRERDVWRTLDSVLDPELDEPVTSLGFVTRVAIEGDAVAVDFRLPTYWCSPNFAWIMAEDMRDVLRALPWIRHVTVTLADHLFASKINAAVNGGETFGEAFAEAGGDLVALRAVFRRKAYLGRMSALIDALRHDGRGDAELVAMTVGDVREIAAGRDRHERARLAARHLEFRAVHGGPCGDGDAAFRTAEGEDITADGLPLFLRGVRMTRRSAEANGEMCRIYLKERVAGEARSSTPPALASSGK
jgi:metal-sulfur cluster biosynthetic enzyme